MTVLAAIAAWLGIILAILVTELAIVAALVLLGIWTMKRAV